MKTKLNIALVLFLACILISISGCQDDSSDSASITTTAEEEYSVNGYVQKGPFVSGSSITIQSLSNTLASTGTSYQTTITDDFGTFSMGKKIKGKYVEIIAAGFYFDEVAGVLSSANYTLRAIADLSSKESVNVNVLTTLEKDRIIYLMTEGGKSFSDAKTQAEKEILSIFNISASNTSSFDGMDISKTGDSNAILLAVSAILQGNNSVAELSELISKINLDIKADGTLDNESYKTEIKTNADSLDLAQVRSNLISRYSNLGLTVTIPDFENYAKNLVPGFSITGISGNTDENGQAATFTVKLKSPPESGVLISIASSDATEGTVNPSSLSFAPSNWNTSQMVTVTGVDDNEEDGDQTFTVSLNASNSADSVYASLPSSSISVINEQRYWSIKSNFSGKDAGCAISISSSIIAIVGIYTPNLINLDSCTAPSGEGYVNLYSLDGTSLWSKRLSTVGNFISVKHDSSGNIIALGSTSSASNNGNGGGTIVKYNSSGTVLWNVTLNPEYRQAIETDSSDNIFTVGRSSTNQQLLAKYNSSGTEQWTAAIGEFGGSVSDGRSTAYGIALDASGNIYTVGSTQYADTFDGHNTFDGSTHTDKQDATLVKYNTSGTKQWSAVIGTTGENDLAYAVDTDSNNNVYITGATSGNLDGNTNSTPGYQAIFVSKFNSSGTKQWTKLTSGTSGQGTYGGKGIVIDSSDNIYVTSSARPSVSLDGNTNLGGSDIILIKYNTDGTKLWTKQTGGTGYDFANGIDLDSSGNIFITGETNGNIDKYPASGDNYYIIKYESNGVRP
ncbi:SBBP repeat-containing protein [bacterium]|nr:SBBP repeat-containing protein [bacterium]